MKQELLFANNISSDSPGRGAKLDQLSLSVYTGEVLGLFGSRYAGKSALFRVLLGELPVRSGELLWNGSADNPRPKAVRIGKNSAMVGDLLLWESIAMLWNPSATGAALNAARIKKMIRLYLEDYQLSFNLNERTASLSQIEKIAVELVMALRRKVRLLMVDLNGVEGTFQEYEMLRRLLARVCQEQAAVIISTHRAEIISFLSDRIAILFQGQILKTIAQEAATTSGLEALSMALYQVKKREAQPISALREEVFRVAGLDAGLPEPVEFSLYRGEIFTIVSPQRDMLHILRRRILDGYQEKTSPVLFKGRAIKRLGSLKGIAFLDMQEIDQLIEGLSPLENLCLGISQKAGGLGFAGRNIARCIEQDFTEWYRNGNFLHQKNCRELYKKDRIAINLFRLRLCNAEVIFCNTLNVYNDVVTLHMVRDVLASLTESGAAVCIFSSDSSYQEELAERTVVLGDG